ncbi:hypothetical protein [Streptomyces sp. NPDC059278]|uniref:hypothetical protein n=1 Tax=Streptomyces sp. NPDC059278 TaxID=3346801 RepID=UPI003687CC15
MLSYSSVASSVLLAIGITSMLFAFAAFFVLGFTAWHARILLFAGNAAVGLSLGVTGVASKWFAVGPAAGAAFLLWQLCRERPAPAPGVPGRTGNP